MTLPEILSAILSAIFRSSLSLTLPAILSVIFCVENARASDLVVGIKEAWLPWMVVVPVHGS